MILTTRQLKGGKGSITVYPAISSRRPISSFVCSHFHLRLCTNTEHLPVLSHLLPPPTHPPLLQDSKQFRYVHLLLLTAVSLCFFFTLELLVQYLSISVLQSPFCSHTNSPLLTEHNNLHLFSSHTLYLFFRLISPLRRCSCPSYIFQVLIIVIQPSRSQIVSIAIFTMSKQDPTDQVKFLVSCIGHTTNGRVSLSLSRDINILSLTRSSLISRPSPTTSIFAPRPLRKSSSLLTRPQMFVLISSRSQKRYERMLKSHGITTRGGAAASAVANGSSDVPAPSTPTKRKGRAAPTGSAKKRGKVAAKTEEYDDYDDDEDTKPTKRGSRNSLKAEEADSESPLSGEHRPSASYYFGSPTDMACSQTSHRPMETTTRTANPDVVAAAGLLWNLSCAWHREADELAL